MSQREVFLEEDKIAFIRKAIQSGMDQTLDVLHFTPNKAAYNSAKSELEMLIDLRFKLGDKA